MYLKQNYFYFEMNIFLTFKQYFIFVVGKKGDVTYELKAPKIRRTIFMAGTCVVSKIKNS